MLKSPANGAPIPPNFNQGEPLSSAFSDVLACWGVVGTGLLPPSMNTSPSRSLAPGFPWKFHVA